MDEKDKKLKQTFNQLHEEFSESSLLLIEGSSNNNRFFVRSASNMDKRGQRIILIHSLALNSRIDIEKIITFVNENMITHGR